VTRWIARRGWPELAAVAALAAVAITVIVLAVPLQETSP
jgi:type IV secretory pathway component VirB8